MPYHRRWRRGCKASPSLPGWLSSLESLASRAPHPAACVAAPSDPCRDGSRTHQPPLLHEVRPSAWSTWSDRPASRTSTGSHPSAVRRCERSGRGFARCRGPAAPARLPAEREPARRRGTARARRAARCSSCGRRLSPAATSARSTCWSSRPDTTLTASPSALLEELLRSASNKGCSMVEAAEALRSRGPRPPRAGRASPPPGQRSGGPSRRPVPRPAEPSALGGRKRRTAPLTVGVNVGKNVAVFVDVANIFYAAKAAGVDIDYVTLLKSATAGRDFVRAYAYTGLDPDNENQRNFHQFLRAHQLQGRQQGHPQVRRRQGQGEPRHRARRRHDEDRTQPRHRRRRVGRRRLRLRHPRGPGDGRPRARSSASAATRRRT